MLFYEPGREAAVRQVASEAHGSFGCYRRRRIRQNFPIATRISKIVIMSNYWAAMNIFSAAHARLERRFGITAGAKISSFWKNFENP
jgi:hypothetical protein